jgi:hypothetical protein
MNQVVAQIEEPATKDNVAIAHPIRRGRNVVL